MKNKTNKFIKEFYGGAKKGSIIWKYEDIENLIQELLSFGVTKNEVLNKITTMIDNLDEEEKVDLSYVTENNIEKKILNIFKD